MKLLLNTQDKNFDEIAAFVLCLHQENIEYFLHLEEFKKLSKTVVTNGFLDASTLYEFCFIVLSRVQSQPELAPLYISVFEYIFSQELITKQEKDKLKSIFEPLTLHVEQIDKDENDFIKNKEVLKSTIQKAKELFDSEILEENLENIQNYMQKQSFSIGITGVMNVGKSTFINSLLGSELLGSSVVAETANLSIIKYAKEPYTNVMFFNKKEFDEILHTFENDEVQRKKFTDLQSSLDIDKYVKDESVSIEIDRKNLYMYTSASDKSELCHIVKNVELGVDMEFLQDNIEIVDTPGLDDTLIVRESITKGYVAECDLLIHLMNVNQSATQNDVDFIIDAITKQDVSSVLVLLTKADNITKEELIEVVEYTRQSIQNQLSAYSNDANVLKVMSSIEFLSISALGALNGDLINSGITEVKTYLHDTLFTNNNKNDAIVQTAIKRLSSTIQAQLKAYKYNLELYSKDEGALEDELRSFNKTKETNKSNLKQISTNIELQYSEFKTYLSDINISFDSDTLELKLKLLQRISDEIIYTLKEKKVELKDTQLKMIVDKTINHGFIDIVREHKYKLEQKTTSIRQEVELNFKKYDIKLDEAEDEFSMSELFEKNTSSSLNTNIKMIVQELILLVKNIKLSKIESFKEKFASVLENELSYVRVHVEQTINELNETIQKSFFLRLKKPIINLENEMKDLELSLEKQIFLLQDKDEDIEELKIKTQTKINHLSLMLEALK